MAAKNKVTASVQPAIRWPTSVERRAAQTAALATQQARLKQEAADRRLNAAKTPPSKSRPRRHTAR
jgi:hypothetical protein